MPENSDPKPRRRFPVLFVVCLAVLVVLAAGGVFVWKYVIGGWERTEEYSETFAEALTRLEVDGDSGAVEVVEASGDETVVATTVRWRGEHQPKHTQKIDGKTLRLKDSGCPRAAGFSVDCSVSWRIEVPSDVDLDLAVDSGMIATSGIKGTQTLHNDSGATTVEDPGAKLTIKGDSGNIEATGMPGTDVDVKLDSGWVDLRFTEAPGKVGVDNDSGAVNVRLPDVDEDYDIHTETGSGVDDVEVRTDPDSDHKVVATTDSGHVSVEYA